MKPFFLLSLVVLIVTSCANPKEPVQNNEPANPNVITPAENDSKEKAIDKPTEDFDSFYQKFHSDKAFQLSRVKFPVEGSYNDFDTVMHWTRSNWEYLVGTIDQVDTVKYNVKFEKQPGKVVEGFYCKECGFSYEAWYSLVDGSWYLTHREDNNF